MVALGLCFLLGSQFYEVEASERLFMGLLSVCAPILLLPVEITYGAVENVPRTINIPLECLSSSGILIAIVTAISAGGLYLRIFRAAAQASSPRHIKPRHRHGWRIACGSVASGRFTGV